LAGSSVIEVAAGLVFRDGKLLIAQRYETDHQGGLWEFPGGKRRPHECYESCLRREILEELGMEIEVGSVLEEITHAYPDRTVQLRFFLCTWSRREPRSLGCQAWAWITRDELLNYDFPPADRHLLRRLQEDAQLWSKDSPAS
jgi:mutator protein MutT